MPLGETVKTVVASSGKCLPALSTPLGGEPITISWPPFANVDLVAPVNKVTVFLDVSKVADLIATWMQHGMNLPLHSLGRHPVQLIVVGIGDGRLIHRGAELEHEAEHSFAFRTVPEGLRENLLGNDRRRRALASA